LVPGGLIFPDKATIYAAAIEDGDYKEERIGFWKDVYGFDYTPFQEIALAEPLVDTVELRAVISDPCPVFEFDLYTVQISDLAFSKSFQLKARRDDIVHAIISWFDIEFSKCHKPIRFSTGPHAKYTHWKQTVFYLQDELLIKNGESINGTLTSIPNKRNPRDLDIAISYDFFPDDHARSSQAALDYVMR
jgi:protein arginine N-methyltransferase 1